MLKFIIYCINLYCNNSYRVVNNKNKAGYGNSTSVCRLIKTLPIDMTAPTKQSLKSHSEIIRLRVVPYKPSSAQRHNVRIFIIRITGLWFGNLRM